MKRTPTHTLDRMEPISIIVYTNTLAFGPSL